MKRLLVLLLALSLLCACSDGMRTSDLMARLITAADDLPGSYLTYYSDADPDTAQYLDAQHMAQLYYEGLDLAALCEDYAILIGQADIPYEIHLLRARATSDVPELLAAVSARKGLLAKHKNDQYRTQITERTEQAFAYSCGRYVILLVTDDNEALKDRIGKLI